MALTQREDGGAVGEAVEGHPVGWHALVEVQQRVDGEDHHSSCRDKRDGQSPPHRRRAHRCRAAPSPSLTDGLGDSQRLGAVEGQVAEGPDDGMDLLHDVEGDGHDAAGVLAHRHPPARGDRGRVTPPGGRCGGSPGDARGSPRPGLVGLEEDEEGGLVVAVEELHVDDVEELLVQLPHVDDVAGQEAGLLPGGGERGGGERLRTPPPAPTGGRGGGV